MKSRFKNLLNYSLNCIQRYKVRTLVVLICLIVASSLFSSVAFMEDSLKKDGELSLKYSADLTVQGIEAGRQSYINTSYISAIQKISGVREVTQRIWGYGNIGNTLIVIVGVDLNSSTINPAAAYPLEAGSFLDTQKNGTIVIGKAVADLLGAEVGETLSILSESNQIYQFTIAGIFNTDSSIYSADMIIMNLNDARSFFKVPKGKVTDLNIYVTNVDPSGREAFVNFVARGVSELPNVRVLTKNILLNAQETTLGARSGFFSVVWYVILIAVALIAFNQTVVVGHESKFEVGLLKALGFSTSDVIQVRLLESAILGTIAGSVGLAVGILYDVVFKAPVLGDFMLGWATIYPNFSLPIYISAQTVLITYAITIVPLLFATVIPSWLNATVDPDIAMRGARA